jgi:hypothetical protein
LVIVVGVVWALAIWRILVATAEYVFFTFENFSGQEVTPALEWGLLALALVGAALWALATPRDRRIVELHLHTTQLLSGTLFVLMGLLLLNGTLATFNTLVPPDLAIWFAGIEDKLIGLFN